MDVQRSETFVTFRRGSAGYETARLATMWNARLCKQIGLVRQQWKAIREEQLQAQTWLGEAILPDPNVPPHVCPE